MSDPSASNGEAFGINGADDTPEDLDAATFNLKNWIKGTGNVTRSVAVCGMPQLMGHIEALKDELERTQAAPFDDDRPLVKTAAMELAEKLEAARAEMLASMVTFRFRGLHQGELEKIKAEHGPDDGEGITDLDYKVWARQCVEVIAPNGRAKGIGWEDLKAMHIGDEESGIEGLGSYFVQTIARKANEAATGGGVDVPFSSASSSLIASSSKS